MKYVDDLRLVVNSHRDDRITISTHDLLALLGEYSALESRLAELEKDAARYRAIMDNEWLDRNMQPSALQDAAATKAGGMLEAVLDQCIDEA